jgi:hypothetical protein
MNGFHTEFYRKSTLPFWSKFKTTFDFSHISSVADKEYVISFIQLCFIYHKSETAVMERTPPSQSVSVDTSRNDLV